MEIVLFLRFIHVLCLCFKKKNIHIPYFKKMSTAIIVPDLKIIEEKQLFKLVKKCIFDVRKKSLV